jgi:hypothetical protein
LLSVEAALTFTKMTARHHRKINRSDLFTYSEIFERPNEFGRAAEIDLHHVFVGLFQIQMAEGAIAKRAHPLI